MNDNNFLEKLYQSHCQSRNIPSPDKICAVINGLLEVLFPELAEKKFTNYREFELRFNTLRLQLNKILELVEFELPKSPLIIENIFFERLPFIHDLLLKDAAAISAGDPAAQDTREVIRTYPGFYAIAIHRIAHELHLLNVPLIPRILSEYAHSKTGIDIHPGAVIGKNFCIDHGTGIVIGGTSIIGDNVKIYQGVTLGALSVRKDLASTKRHPTIEDDVVIYAGATILGGDTVIGKGSVIGGNTWLPQSVPPGSRVYYKANAKHNTSNEEIIIKQKNK